MKKLAHPVLLAQIGAPHGVKGEVRVKSFTGDPMALADYGPLFSADGRRFEITSLRPAKTVLVVRFKGINSRNEVENLNRLELFVERAMLPDNTEEDEFYIADLVGMAVQDQSGDVIGTVLDVPNFGAGDMLEIAPDADSGKGTQSYYLAFTRQTVPEIDFDNNRLTVFPPVEVSGREEK